MEEEKAKITKYIDQLMETKTKEELKKWYDEWGARYDHECELFQYSGPIPTVQCFVELGLPKDTRILDIAAGTGNVGVLLQKNGFTNIDALDASDGMLEMAKQKKCYNKLITSFVAKDIRLPIDDQTYDVAICCGAMCANHIKWDSFPQIIRVVKKGGIVFWVLTLDEKYLNDDDFRDGRHEKIVQTFVDQKLWQFVDGFPKRAENYFEGTDAKIWAMKVL